MMKAHRQSPSSLWQRRGTSGTLVPQRSRQCFALIATAVAILVFVLFGYSEEYQLGSSTLELLALVGPNGEGGFEAVPSTGKDSTPMQNGRKHDKLPDLSKGGIAIFFHVPKTGGSSIKDAARASKQIEYNSNERRRNSGGMQHVKDLIRTWTNSKTEDIIGEGKPVKFVELHWDLESAVSLDQELSEWRANAEKNNIPFFVFAMVRDPLSTHLSFFNFFCIYLHKGRHVKCPGPYTVDKLIEISPDNPQTRWLCYATTMALNNEVVKPMADCRSKLFEIADRQFDWVGAMERFKETLAMFSAMGVEMKYQYKNKIKGMEKIEKSDINATALAILDKQLTVDKEFVDWAEKAYTLKNFGIDPAVET